MPSLNGAIQGGMSGYGLGGPIGAAVGVLSGAIFGSDPEEEMQKRLNRLVAVYKQSQIADRNRIIAGRAQNLGLVRQQVARQAAAAGVEGLNLDAYLAPAQQGVLTETDDLLRKNDQVWGDRIAAANADFVGRPIQPSPLDYALQGAAAINKFEQGNKYIDALGKMGQNGTMNLFPSSPAANPFSAGGGTPTQGMPLSAKPWSQFQPLPELLD